MVGDRPLAIFDGPARAVRCAFAIVEYALRLGVEMRAGLHTGECDMVDGKVGGIATEIGIEVSKRAAAERCWSQTLSKIWSQAQGLDSRIEERIRSEDCLANGVSSGCVNLAKCKFPLTATPKLIWPGDPLDDLNVSTSTAARFLIIVIQITE